MVRKVDRWRLPHLSSADEWVEADMSTLCKPFPLPISCLCLQHQHMALGLPVCCGVVNSLSGLGQLMPVTPSPMRKQHCSQTLTTVTSVQDKPTAWIQISAFPNVLSELNASACTHTHTRCHKHHAIQTKFCVQKKCRNLE